MEKTTKQKRLLKLMERINWKNKGAWTKFEKKFQEEEIPYFRQWLVKNLVYIKDIAAKEALMKWFVEGISKEPNSGFYIFKDRGIAAVEAMYAKEQDNG